MSRYIFQADLAARVSNDTMLRVFDKEGTGAVNSTFAQLCCDNGESEFIMRCGASFPGNFDDGGAVVDPAVKNAMCSIAFFKAVELNPSAAGTDKELGPYEKAFKRACDFADRLSKDDRNRLHTSAGGRARPRAAVTNDTNAVTTLPTNPFTRASDGTDGSNF